MSFLMQAFFFAFFMQGYTKVCPLKPRGKR